jgi:hypothetical protein
MEDQADARRAARSAPGGSPSVERYLLGENEYVLRSSGGDARTATRFELVVQGRPAPGGQPVERLLSEITAADADRARDIFWTRLAMELLDDPERVAYAEVGLERAAMVRDATASRWHVGVAGARVKAGVSTYANPAEALRAWLGYVQTMTPGDRP